MAVWSSGMILASGARGPGFNSQNGPCPVYSSNFELTALQNMRGSLHATDTNHQGAREPIKVVPRGLEPRTLRLLAVRSNQLSYETSEALASQCALQQTGVRWRPRHQIMLPAQQPASTAVALPLTRQMLPARGGCQRLVQHHVTLDVGRLE